MAQLTNGFVRKDGNSEIGFLPPTQSEAMMMGDGSVMPATAFRDDYPITKYTPQELGINVEASPFYDPETNSQSQAAPMQPSGSSTVIADNGTTPESFDSQDIQVLSDAAKYAAGSVNSWISNNIGFMLLGSVLVYGVYRFGVKRGAS
tara:strand:+ start:1198 stop:1641 length:444 start_codon:yes stop_codon:yes gene_type:complete